MGKVAIVIGATGLIGRALVNKLADADHIEQVVSVTRRQVEYTNPKVVNEVVKFDTLEEYASVFSGDILFSCLGTTKKQAGSIEAQRIVDLEYQYRAARLAAENGVKHYLLVSSSGAIAKSKNAYLRMKGELEERVKKLDFERISIFQPSLLLGNRPEVRVGEKIGSILMPALCLIPGLGKYRPVRGDEVASKMVRVSNSSGKDLEWYLLDEIFEN